MKYRVFCAESVQQLEDMINEINEREASMTTIGGVDVSVIDGVPRFCQAAWVHDYPAPLRTFYAEVGGQRFVLGEEAK